MVIIIRDIDFINMPSMIIVNLRLGFGRNRTAWPGGRRPFNGGVLVGFDDGHTEALDLVERITPCLDIRDRQGHHSDRSHEDR